MSNLPFDGLYTGQALIDVLQNTEGVEQAELIAACSRYGAYAEFRKINARSTPHAGYYSITDENLVLNFMSNEEYL